MRNKAFTLIEMLVVITVFLIILGSLVGMFIFTIRTQRYYLASQKLLDQTSYAMEYMSRLMRMAQEGTIDCTGGQNYWLSLDGKHIKFMRVVSGALECQEFRFTGSKIQEKLGNREWLDLSSNDIDVTKLEFSVSGDVLNDDLQPKVTIFLGAQGTNPDPKPKVKLQTTVSQRDLDD